MELTLTQKKIENVSADLADLRLLADVASSIAPESLEKSKGAIKREKKQVRFSNIQKQIEFSKIEQPAVPSKSEMDAEFQEVVNKKKLLKGKSIKSLVRSKPNAQLRANLLKFDIPKTRHTVIRCVFSHGGVTIGDILKGIDEHGVGLQVKELMKDLTDDDLDEIATNMVKYVPSDSADCFGNVTTPMSIVSTFPNTKLQYHKMTPSFVKMGLEELARASYTYNIQHNSYHPVKEGMSVNDTIVYLNHAVIKVMGYKMCRYVQDAINYVISLNRVKHSNKLNRDGYIYWLQYLMKYGVYYKPIPGFYQTNAWAYTMPNTDLDKEEKLLELIHGNMSTFLQAIKKNYRLRQYIDSQKYRIYNVTKFNHQCNIRFNYDRDRLNHMSLLALYWYDFVAKKCAREATSDTEPNEYGWIKTTIEEGTSVDTVEELIKMTETLDLNGRIKDKITRHELYAFLLKLGRHAEYFDRKDLSDRVTVVLDTYGLRQEAEGPVPSEVSDYKDVVEHAEEKILDPEERKRNFMSKVRDSLKVVMTNFNPIKAVTNETEKILEKTNATLDQVNESRTYIQGILDSIKPFIEKAMEVLTPVLDGINYITDFATSLDWEMIIAVIICILLYEYCESPIIKAITIAFITFRFRESIVHLVKHYIFDYSSTEEREATGLVEMMIEGYEICTDTIKRLMCAIMSCITGSLLSKEQISTLWRMFLPSLNGIRILGQAATGFFALSRLANAIISFIPEAYAYLTGDKTLSKIKKETVADFNKWLVATHEMSTTPGLYLLLHSNDMKEKCIKLHGEIPRFTTAFVNGYLPTQLLSIFNEYRRSLVKAYNTAMQTTIYGNPRVTPFHIQFYSKPGVGKSSFNNYLFSWIRQKYFPDTPPNQLKYERNPNMDHWDNYNDQPILTRDEAWPIRDAGKIAEDLLIVSCNSFPLPMASLEDKGTRFLCSKFYITNTNNPKPECADVYCMDAIYRRRHLLVEVESDERVHNKTTGSFDINLFNQFYPGQESTEYPHLRFSICKPNHDGMNDKYYKISDIGTIPYGLNLPLAKMNLRSFLHVLEKSYNAHILREEKITGAQNVEDIINSNIDEVLDFLDSAKADIKQMPPLVQIALGRVPKALVIDQENLKPEVLEAAYKEFATKIQREPTSEEETSVFDDASFRFVDTVYEAGKTPLIMTTAKKLDEYKIQDLVNDMRSGKVSISPELYCAYKGCSKRECNCLEEYNEIIDGVEISMRPGEAHPHQQTNKLLNSILKEVEQIEESSDITLEEAMDKLSEHYVQLVNMHSVQVDKALEWISSMMAHLSGKGSAETVARNKAKVAQTDFAIQGPYKPNFLRKNGGIYIINSGIYHIGGRYGGETLGDSIADFGYKLSYKYRTPLSCITFNMRLTNKQRALPIWKDCQDFKLTTSFVKRLRFDEQDNLFYLDLNGQTYMDYLWNSDEVDPILRQLKATLVTLHAYKLYDQMLAFGNLTFAQQMDIYRQWKGAHIIHSLFVSMQHVVKTSYEKVKAATDVTRLYLKQIYKDHSYAFKVGIGAMCAVGIVFIMRRLAAMILPRREETSKVLKHAKKGQRMVVINHEPTSDTTFQPLGPEHKISKALVEVTIHSIYNKQSVKGIRTGSLVILPAHAIPVIRPENGITTFADQSHITLEFKPTPYGKDTWLYNVEAHHIYIKPGTDTCFIYLRDAAPTKDISKLFIKNNTLDKVELPKFMSLMFFHKGIYNQVTAPLISYSIGDYVLHGTNRDVAINSKMLNVDYFPEVGYSGSVIVAPVMGGKHMISGIMSSRSRDPRNSAFSLVTQEDITLAYSKFKIPKIEGPLNLIDKEPTSAVLFNEHVEVLGSIQPHLQTGYADKSKLQKSLLFDEFNSQSIPAILSSHDPRVTPGTHPLQHSLNKTGRDVMLPIEPEDLKLAASWMADYVEDVINLRNVSIDFQLEEILKGTEHVEKVNTKTSPGIPYIWNREKPGKLDLFSFDEDGELEFVSPELRKDWAYFNDKLDDNIQPAGQMYEFAKDELRPANKAYNPETHLIKTRSISVLPLCYNLLYRQMNMTLISELNRHFCSIMVGKNPFSPTWANVFNILRMNDNRCLDVDIGNWDGHWTRQLAYALTDYRLEVLKRALNKQGYRSNQVQERLKRYRKCMDIFYDFVVTGPFQFKDGIFRKQRGLASGCGGTANDNSETHLMLIMAFYINKARHRGFCDLQSFLRYIKVFVYGDDLLLSVSRDIMPVITYQDFINSYRHYGWPVTMANKESEVAPRPIEECQFLKRSFKPDPNGTSMILCPITLTTIEDMLSWIRASETPREQLAININIALEELYMHGEETYNEYRMRIINALSKKNMRIRAPTYGFMNQVMRNRYYGIMRTEDLVEDQPALELMNCVHYNTDNPTIVQLN